MHPKNKNKKSAGVLQYSSTIPNIVRVEFGGHCAAWLQLLASMMVPQAAA
jgi:hypothetical protein